MEKSFKFWWQHMNCIRSKSRGHSFRLKEEKWNELRMGATVLHVKLIMKIMDIFECVHFCGSTDSTPTTQDVQCIAFAVHAFNTSTTLLTFYRNHKIPKIVFSRFFFSLRCSHAWERLRIFRFSLCQSMARTSDERLENEQETAYAYERYDMIIKICVTIKLLYREAELRRTGINRLYTPTRLRLHTCIYSHQTHWYMSELKRRSKRVLAVCRNLSAISYTCCRCQCSIQCFTSAIFCRNKFFMWHSNIHIQYE